MTPANVARDQETKSGSSLARWQRAVAYGAAVVMTPIAILALLFLVVSLLPAVLSLVPLLMVGRRAGPSHHPPPAPVPLAFADRITPVPT